IVAHIGCEGDQGKHAAERQGRRSDELLDSHRFQRRTILVVCILKMLRSIHLTAARNPMLTFWRKHPKVAAYQNSMNHRSKNVIPAPPHNYRYCRTWKKMKRLLGWLDDGTPVLESGDESFETVEVLPAQPGWFVLQAFAGKNGEPDIYKIAVVAWQLRTMSG